MECKTCKPVTVQGNSQKIILTACNTTMTNTPVYLYAQFRPRSRSKPFHTHVQPRQHRKFMHEYYLKK